MNAFWLYSIGKMGRQSFWYI